MNSSKGWGDKPQQNNLDQLENKRWRRIWITFAVLASLPIGGYLLYGLGLKLVYGNPHTLIQQARQELTEALANDDITSQVEHAATAEDLMRTTLQVTGNQQTPLLLLSAALSLRKHDDSFTEENYGELTDFSSQLLAQKCETDDLLLAAEAFFHSGDLSRADWAMGHLLTHDEGDRTPILHLAVQVHFDLGSEDNVLEMSKELAERDPKDCMPWMASSYVYENRQNPEGMVDCYRALLERNCEEPDETRKKLVGQLIVLGTTADARKEYEILKLDDPQLVADNCILEAKLLSLEGKSEEASKVAAEVLTKQPKNVEALVLISRQLLSQQEYKQTIENLLKVIQLDPVHTQAHYLLGQAYARDGQKEKAREYLAKQKAILDMLVELHRLERIAGSNSQDVETRQQIAKMYEIIGWNEKAEYWRQAAIIAGR
ncbi:MAG: tetratricopeptide repeat protein [Pirellulales bacterium]